MATTASDSHKFDSKSTSSSSSSCSSDSTTSSESESGSAKIQIEPHKQTRDEPNRLDTQSECSMQTGRDTDMEVQPQNNYKPSERNNPSRSTTITDSSRRSSQSSGHFTVSWHQLDYVVESKWYKLASERRQILTNLNGSFKSGELTAILGPSGSGKSSLIDCILGSREGISGRTKVSFESSQLEAERRRKRPLRIALIPQEDHLLDSLTVSETFMFASRIKNAHLQLDKSSSSDLESELVDKNGKFDHVANVQRVLKQLNLTSCASLKCKKLSGGQYKRVSIGQELLSRPDVMILDEPTSGLDSVTCFQTVKALRQLIESSQYPMAIVATIHQPDNEVFNLFHKAYVLAQGGRAIYEGPTDCIVNTVRSGIELVEARRKQPFWQLADSSARAASSSPGGESTESGSKSYSSQLVSLDRLRNQLDDDKGCNPARLIVEVAANEHGFGIISSMAELQTSLSEQCNSRLDHYHSNLQSTSSSHLDLTAANSAGSYKSASVLSLVTSASSVASSPDFDYDAQNPRSKRRPNLDGLLNLVKSNTKQSRSLGVQLRHVWYHTQRSWLTIRRDPMLFSIMIALHVLVPLMISYAFQETINRDACPNIKPLDVVDEAYRSGSMLDELNLELRSAFENLGYMFFQIYVIIFAAVCVTSLTYPLAMHVLLKEYRNGWYSLSTYFLGRTLADLPVPTFNVALAMAISYHLTGQPLSPYCWRFISVATLTVLATLVAQTQGLMFGAMLMNAPQAAVFVAPASTAPLVVVSGFLLRIRSLPWVLQLLSYFSYFTHVLNGYIISRYGFNRCPCEQQDFTITGVPQIPGQARALINIWVETYAEEYGFNANSNSSNALATTANDTRQVDLINKLLLTIDKAKTFGHQMAQCDQVKPFAMLDYQLNDSDLALCFYALLLMLFFYRWLTYAVLSWKIRSCL